MSSSNTNISTIDFYSHPFGIPATEVDSNKTNAVLQKSWSLQKSLRCSNACMQVCVIVRKCLASLDIDTNITYGLISSYDLKIPHVWLEKNGHIIDNTFVEDTPEELLVYMRRARGREQYLCEDVSGPDIFLGDYETYSLGITKHNVAAFKWGLKNEQKLLASSRNITHIKEYMSKMSEFISHEYGREVKMFSESEMEKCWTCGQHGDVKQCTKCKVAKYCCKECQRKDWFSPGVHKYVCFLPVSY